MSCPRKCFVMLDAHSAIAPGIEPDLDDSSKTSIVLSFCGRPGLTSRIMDHFDSEDCLKTYRSERNSSVSANCNALFALLVDQTSSSSRIKMIEKVVSYLCERWTSANGWLDDKWVSTHLGRGGPAKSGYSQRGRACLLFTL